MFGPRKLRTGAYASALALALALTGPAFAEQAERPSDGPLLVAHGTTDEVLPDACSRDIHRRAKEPKRLVLYPGCRHGLDQCREPLDRDLLAWIREVTATAR